MDVSGGEGESEGRREREEGLGVWGGDNAWLSESTARRFAWADGWGHRSTFV